mmetsp:Transcript_21904/g.62175  ORF Transcript_21904/g.62175 Transcript_21904/m.62175 type:complete len:128 (+) Transcript_21904:595-978(+)
MCQGCAFLRQRDDVAVLRARPARGLPTKQHTRHEPWSRFWRIESQLPRMPPLLCRSQLPRCLPLGQFEPRDWQQQRQQRSQLHQVEFLAVVLSASEVRDWVCRPLIASSAATSSQPLAALDVKGHCK